MFLHIVNYSFSTLARIKTIVCKSSFLFSVRGFTFTTKLITWFSFKGKLSFCLSIVLFRDVIFCVAVELQVYVVISFTVLVSVILIIRGGGDFLLHFRVCSVAVLAT